MLTPLKMARLSTNLMSTWVFLLGTLIGTSLASSHSSANHKTPHQPETVCAEPEDLRQRLDDLYTGNVYGQMHETFYMVPFLRETALNRTRQHDFNLEDLNRTKVFSGSAECPAGDTDYEKTIHKQGGDPCPIYHTVNTDPNRYPRVLLEAQCRCTSCKGINRRQHPRSAIPTCEGMYYYVRVLRRARQCVKGVYNYIPTWEKVQVGCACRFVPVSISY